MARILVIEDDKSMNDILAETLTDEGHEVRAAYNGDDAAALCRGMGFDLVVTDVRLPGMDGVDTLAAIRRSLPGVKCIIITGYASADTPVRAIRLKVDDYLFKPFSLKYFLNVVNRVLYSEQEKREKSALFGRLFSVFSKVKDRRLADLVEERQEAFRGLFVGARSGFLSARAGLEVYTKLELLEPRFRAILNAESADPDRLRELQELYAAIGQRIASFEQGEAEEAPNEGVLSLAKFQALYDALKSSEIGIDDLLYAPLLRETPDERFETLPVLLELKRKLWP